MQALRPGRSSAASVQRRRDISGPPVVIRRDMECVVVCSGRFASQIARCCSVGDSVGKAGCLVARCARRWMGRPGVVAETRWPEKPEAALAMEATLAQEKEGSVVDGGGRGGVGGGRGLVISTLGVVGCRVMAESLRSRDRARGMMLLDAMVRGLT